MKHIHRAFACVLTLAALSTSSAQPATGKNPGSQLPRWRDTTGMAFVRDGGAPSPVRSFYIDERNVSRAQFCLFLNDGNGQFWREHLRIAKTDGKHTPQPGTDAEPITHVTRSAAETYARWAGKRLPSTTELQRAAKSEVAVSDAAVSDEEFGRNGFRCVRPTRRVLVLVAENFEEVELGAYTGILSWASHTKPAGNYMFKEGAAEVPNIEVVIAGFAPEIHGMGGMNLRPHVLVKDLTPADLDHFDAVAIPAAVGGARGQHTWQGRSDLESQAAVAIVKRIHANAGFISTMCAGSSTLSEAALPVPRTTPDTPVALDSNRHTATSAGPGVAVEAACLLVQQLTSTEEYRAFRQSNPWIFGGKDQYPPRDASLR